MSKFKIMNTESNKMRKKKIKDSVLIKELKELIKEMEEEENE